MWRETGDRRLQYTFRQGGIHPPPANRSCRGWRFGFANASVLASVGVFIFYINHMSHAIRASTVIDSVARETRQTLERLYPEEPRDR